MAAHFFSNVLLIIALSATVLAHAAPLAASASGDRPGAASDLTTLAGAGQAGSFVNGAKDTDFSMASLDSSDPHKAPVSENASVSPVAVPSGDPVSPVPEPGGGMLLLSGLGVLALVGGRKDDSVRLDSKRFDIR